MIDILKKKFKIGDQITIRTSEGTFTGNIESFEETCIILTTIDGNEEFIANEAIRGVSAVKDSTLSDKPKQLVNEAPSKLEQNLPDLPLSSVQILGDNIPTYNPQTVKPITEYKVGETIPLEVLNKLSNRRNKFPKAEAKPLKKIGSFEELSSLIIPELEAESKLNVPANGIIKTFFPDKKFGFIRDKNNYDIWFSFSRIIDEDLLLLLTRQTYNASIPVLFTFSKNDRGDTAIYIHKPKTVEQIAELSKKYYDEGSISTAISLLDQVLTSFPDSIITSRLKDKFQGHKTKTINIQSNFENNNRIVQSFHFEATKAKNVEKNFDKALEYYMIALQKNEKRESCIKDIAMLLVSMDQPENALNFIAKHEYELFKNITTYNYFVNFFSSVRNFEKVLEYVDLLLNEKYLLKDKRKHSLYLSQKGFALIQLKKIDDARIALEEAVNIFPENVYPTRLLKALDEQDSDELQNIIDESEFNNYGGGLSKIIQNSLENCDYKGLKATSIEEGLTKQFTKSHLNEIRRYINDTGVGRPKDRANGLLTEAKLIELIEPNNEKDFYSSLARHCNAKALAYISGREHLDIVRFYYLEAFTIEDSWDSVARQVGLYLWSFNASYSDLLSGNPPPFDDLYSDILSEDKEYIWQSLVSLFLANTAIAAKLVERLFINKSLRVKSFNFITNQGVTFPMVKNIEDYTAIWNKVLEKRRLDTNHWFASIIALSKSDSIDILATQYLKVNEDLKKIWLNQLDLSRLREISGVIDKVNDYLRKTLFDDKENEVRTTRQLIYSIITEISDKPTKFSYEGFIPLLERIDFLIEKSFNKVLEISTPKVKILILNEESPVERLNNVPFQISVSNSSECSPIFDIKIRIIDTEQVKFSGGNTQHFDSIKGGQDWIFQLAVQVSDEILIDKATTLDLICEYKIRNQEEPISLQEQLSLRLYTGEEFEPIENPYAPIADGGPVENKKMFYGRDEFINNRIKAILNSDSKQIIIYGQKRSGKSSVLYHLKQGLEETNQTFCILFSLGMIVKELNEYTFYHKIINTIYRELKLRKAKNEIVPSFECPTLDDFKAKYNANPADGFIELIEDFKIASLKIEGWATKKLIIMIDEFTYLYTAIRNGHTSETIMKQWKAITQNEVAKFSVVLVGQDVVPSFKKEDYAKNAFGVIEDIRLTYLEPPDAKQLIEEPILDKFGKTRFIGKAIDTIIEYTSRNPYYIQIFCARLVDYMNAKKVMRVTAADIKDVAETFIEGSNALAPEKFDNLIRAGEEHDFKEFDDEPIIKILRQIALGSINMGICSRDNINLNNNKLEDQILNHLTDREVLERRQGDNYKIQVKLFQEWLLRH
jgi:tetratricopeptide (TPR) repeat protein